MSLAPFSYHRSCLAFCCALLGLCMTGCGGGGESFSKITGRVTDNGQPIKIEPQGMLRIEFLRFDPAAATRQTIDAVSADLNAEGKYSVEVPPGNYAVHIIHHPEYRGPNVLEPVFHGVNSPLVKQIEQDLQLDIEVNEFRKEK